MKKILLTISISGIFFINENVNAQTTVYNEKLFQQITKNQAVRIASENSFFNSYEKQREIYENINKKVAVILGIHEYIYHNLQEVNTVLLHGKKLYYIYKDFEDLIKITKQMAVMSVKKVEYAILLGRFYTKLYENAYNLKKEVTEEILRKGNDFLMDSYDRQRLLDTISMRINNLKGVAYYIILLLKDVEKTPYIYQVPVIRDYVNKDKTIIREILDKYQIIKY